MLINNPLAMSHQIETVKYGLKNPYFICAIDPGGGKTFCALALHEQFKNCKTLVIVPNYLILKWFGEVVKWFGKSKKVTVITKKEQIYALWDTDICIAGYSHLEECEVLFEWADHVVFDEAQFLKEMKTKRTDFAHKLVYENSTKKLNLLTGTPIINRVSEYYSLIALCNYNPKIKKSNFLEKFPDSVTFADHFSFRKSYTMEINGKRIKIVKWQGIKNRDELKKWLDGIYIRFTDKHWMSEDPVYLDVPVSYKNMPELEEAYESFCQSNESGISPTIKMEAAKMTVPYTIKYVRGLIEDGIEKVVIFTDHVEPAKMIAEAFETTAITSEISNSRQFKLVSEFQNNILPSVICGTIGSMSTGHDLYISKDVVFNDESWVPGQNKQAWKRVHRKGQTGMARIHRIYGSPQHERISASLYQKMLDIELATNFEDMK